MKRFTALGVILTPLILGTQAMLAEGYPWQDHTAPFDFLLEPSAWQGFTAPLYREPRHNVGARLPVGPPSADKCALIDPNSATTRIVNGFHQDDDTRTNSNWRKGERPNT